jgi:hypothetical protein
MKTTFSIISGAPGAESEGFEAVEFLAGKLMGVG